MIDNNTLHIVGFPRSGNMFLSYVLYKLYANTDYPYSNVSHKVKRLLEYDKCITPIRNPEDSILSWNLFISQPSKLDLDIKFYKRFHKAVIENMDKIVLFDFNIFSNNIDYVKQKIKIAYDLDTSIPLTIEEAKQLVSETSLLQEYSLPREEDKEEKERVREMLKNSEGFDECEELYKTICSYFS